MSTGFGVYQILQITLILFISWKLAPDRVPLVFSRKSSKSSFLTGSPGAKGSGLEVAIIRKNIIK
jgi:hypothetical protein